MAIGTDFSINSDHQGDCLWWRSARRERRRILHCPGSPLLGCNKILADDAGSTGDDYMDISRLTPSDKQFDTIITLVNGYNPHCCL